MRESGEKLGLVDQIGQRIGLKEHQIKKLQQLVVMGLIGAMILLLADTISPMVKNTSSRNTGFENKIAPQATPAGDRDGLEAWERRLSDELGAMLSEIQGVGPVRVWIKLQSGPEKSMVQNTNTTTRRTTERDSTGVVRETTEENQSSQPVMARGDDRALVRRIEAPRVSNVLVVAEGARYPEVRNRIAQSVQGALGIPWHRIQVSPKEGR